jgi:predicted permease
MNSIMAAVNVVAPMALMMGVGVIMRLTKVTDRDTMKKVDKIIFKVLMSVLMFYNIYNTDLSNLISAGYIAYGVCGLLLLFLIALFVVPRFVKPAATAASFGQGIVRANFILFGVAVAQNIYGEGNVGILMLMGAVAVPMFNILSTIILEYGRSDKTKPAKMVKSIFSNPNVIAAVLGVAVNLSGIHLPDLILDVISDIGSLASPLSFLSLGVSLNVAAVKRNRKLLTMGLLLRLVMIPAVMLVPAYFMGFHGQQLCALMVLFAAPVAVSSYPMAVALDADGELAGQLVAFSTLFSLFTIFGWTVALSALSVL